MKAYWATVVGANIPNQYPGVGNYITRFILGGNDISGFTLTRFYSVHTLILPACLLMLMAVHIYLIRVHNLSDPRDGWLASASPHLRPAVPLYSRAHQPHYPRVAAASS